MSELRVPAWAAMRLAYAGVDVSPNSLYIVTRYGDNGVLVRSTENTKVEWLITRQRVTPFIITEGE